MHTRTHLCASALPAQDRPPRPTDRSVDTIHYGENVRQRVAAGGGGGCQSK